MSTEDPAELQPATRPWRVAVAIAAVIAIGLLRWTPEASHAVVSCLVLIGAALLIHARGFPALIAPRRWLAIAGPAVVGLVTCAAAVALLVGPLHGTVFFTDRLTAFGVIVVLGVPVAEEAFFRGALLRATPSRPVLTVIGSSLLFGLMHGSLGPSQIVWMSLLGLVLAVVALATRSWAIPAVLHAFYNGLAAGYREDAGLYVMLPLTWAIALSVAGLVFRRDES